MRFLLFNQYGPPDPAPTARLLGDLAETLIKQGWEVEWAVDQASYRNRRSGWKRWLAEGLLHWKLLWKGLLAEKPDVVISLTSPVCLLLTATLAAKIRGARHIHWAMDLYPELAVALGEVKENFVTRSLRSLMGMAYRTCEEVVVLDGDMQDHLWEHYQVKAVIIPPWPGPAGMPVQVSGPPPEDGWTWLYSGNLGRAHEWEPLLEVQALLEKEARPAQLVFQGDGAEMLPARRKARLLGLGKCFFREYAGFERFLPSLLEASVLIVTRKPAARGLLWPSKLALLQELAKPLLWVGDTDGHVASQLKKRKETGVFSPGQIREIHQWVCGIMDRQEESPAPPVLPENLDFLAREGLRQWVHLLGGKEWPEGLDNQKSEVG